MLIFVLEPLQLGLCFPPYSLLLKMDMLLHNITGCYLRVVSAPNLLRALAARQSMDHKEVLLHFTFARTPYSSLDMIILRGSPQLCDAMIRATRTTMALRNACHKMLESQEKSTREVSQKLVPGNLAKVTGVLSLLKEAICTLSNDCQRLAIALRVTIDGFPKPRTSRTNAITMAPTAIALKIRTTGRLTGSRNPNPMSTSRTSARPTVV